MSRRIQIPENNYVEDFIESLKDPLTVLKTERPGAWDTWHEEAKNEILAKLTEPYRNPLLGFCAGIAFACVIVSCVKLF